MAEESRRSSTRSTVQTARATATASSSNEDERSIPDENFRSSAELRKIMNDPDSEI
jgi:hypothetical protein